MLLEDPVSRGLPVSSYMLVNISSLSSCQLIQRKPSKRSPKSLHWLERLGINVFTKNRLLDYYVLLGSYFIENPIKYIKGPQCSWFDGKRGLTSFTHINHGLYRGVMNKNRPNCYCWVNFSHFSIQYSLVLHRYWGLNQYYNRKPFKRDINVY